MLKKIASLSILILFMGCENTSIHPIEKLTLEQVQNQINPSETQKILFTLASDSMMGRDSQSGGYFKAAEFVTDYFQANNITPFL